MRLAARWALGILRTGWFITAVVVAAFFAGASVGILDFLAFPERPPAESLTAPAAELAALHRITCPGSPESCPATLGIVTDYDFRVKKAWQTERGYSTLVSVVRDPPESGTASVPKDFKLEGRRIDPFHVTDLGGADVRFALTPSQAPLRLGTTVRFALLPDGPGGPREIVTARAVLPPEEKTFGVLIRTPAGLMVLLVALALLLAVPSRATWGLFLYCAAMNPIVPYLRLPFLPNQNQWLLDVVVIDVLLAVGFFGLTLFALNFSSLPSTTQPIPPAPLVSALARRLIALYPFLVLAVFLVLMVGLDAASLAPAPVLQLIAASHIGLESVNFWGFVVELVLVLAAVAAFFIPQCNVAFDPLRASRTRAYINLRAAAFCAFGYCVAVSMDFAADYFGFGPQSLDTDWVPDLLLAINVIAIVLIAYGVVQRAHLRWADIPTLRWIFVAASFLVGALILNFEHAVESYVEQLQPVRQLVHSRLLPPDWAATKALPERWHVLLHALAGAVAVACGVFLHSRKERSEKMLDKEFEREIAQEEPGLNWHSLSAENAGDLAVLRRFYDEIYVKEFPNPDEREVYENIEGALRNARSAAGDRYRILMVTNGDTPIAASISDYLAGANSGVIEFLTVAPPWRGSGIGTSVRRRTEAYLAEDARAAGRALQYVFAEVEDPYRAAPDAADPREPFLRLGFWSAAGYAVLAFPYVQPPLSAEKAAVDGLLLTAKPVHGDPERVPSHTVVHFLDGYMRFAMRIERPESSPEYGRMASHLLRTATVPLARVPSYLGKDPAVQLHVHAVSSDEDPDVREAIRVYQATFTIPDVSVGDEEFRAFLRPQDSTTRGFVYHLWALRRRPRDRVEGMVSFFTLPGMGFGGYVVIQPQLQDPARSRQLLARVETQMIEDRQGAHGWLIECDARSDDAGEHLPDPAPVFARKGFHEIAIDYRQPPLQSRESYALADAPVLRLLYKPFGPSYVRPLLRRDELLRGIAGVFHAVYGIEEPERSEFYVDVVRQLNALADELVPFRSAAYQRTPL